MVGDWRQTICKSFSAGGHERSRLVPHRTKADRNYSNKERQQRERITPHQQLAHGGKVTIWDSTSVIDSSYISKQTRAPL